MTDGLKPAVLRRLSRCCPTSAQVLLHRVFISVSLVLFVASLAFDAFCADDTHFGPGFGALLLGAGGLLASRSPGNLTWLANPVLVLSWTAIFNGSRKPAIYLSLAALALSGTFLVAGTVVGLKGPMEITCLGPGYWLWLSSTAAAVISALLICPAASASTPLRQVE